MSKASFSCRHAVTVEWSKRQDITTSSPLEAVRVDTRDARFVRVELVTVSCPNSIQSEAFVATAALFSIFALSPREEKAYLRLPSVWRELWMEMSETQKELNDAFDRDTLRKLRKLVADSERSDYKGEAQSSSLDDVNGDARVESHISTESPTSFDDLKSVWMRKCST